MTIKAALLDERGIFLRIDELASEADLTDRHLPQITSCDLPTGQSKWVSDPNPTNTYGGAFWSVAYIEHVEATKRKAADENAKRGRR